VHQSNYATVEKQAFPFFPARECLTFSSDHIRILFTRIVTRPLQFLSNGDESIVDQGRGRVAYTDDGGYRCSRRRRVLSRPVRATDRQKTAFCVVPVDCDSTDDHLRRERAEDGSFSCSRREVAM